MACKWIEYKNNKILFQDYKGADKEEMLSIAEAAFKITIESNEKINILIDIRESYLSDEFMDKIKKIGLSTKHKINKTAIIGIHGIKKVLFNAFNSIIKSNNFKAFNNEDDAKEYLIS